MPVTRWGYVVPDDRRSDVAGPDHHLRRWECDRPRKHWCRLAGGVGTGPSPAVTPDPKKPMDSMVLGYTRQGSTPRHFAW